MKILDDFDFRGSGRGTHYDYDAIFDGRLRLLERGKDYTCQDTSLRSSLFREAASRRMRIKTQMTDGGIVVQAFKKPDKED